MVSLWVGLYRLITREGVCILSTLKQKKVKEYIDEIFVWLKSEILAMVEKQGIGFTWDGGKDILKVFFCFYSTLIQ